MTKIVEMTGMRYGRWTVLRRAENSAYGRLSHWHCRCDCGEERSVNGQTLRLGRSRGCGCERLEILRARAKHGHNRVGNKTKTYKVWQGMRGRCTNPKIKCFSRYGGRGITVCERWSSFEAFLADMGPCPPRLTLERIDNDRGYEPGNCKWATRSEQNRNTRNNVVIEFMGERRCVTDWAKHIGVSLGTLRDRLRKGWPVERALTTHVLKR